MAARIERPATAFSLGGSRKAQGGRREDREHLSAIRGCQCLACGSSARIEAAHVRFADPVAGKPETAMAQKPDDLWTVPLCASCHREGPHAQHAMNEREFWAGLHIDPVHVAIRLYAASGDDDAMHDVIRIARDAAGNPRGKR